MNKKMRFGAALVGILIGLSGCMSAEQVKEWETQQKQLSTITTQPGTSVIKTFAFGTILLLKDETLDTADIVVADASLRGIEQLRLREISSEGGVVQFQISMRIDDNAPDGEQSIQLLLKFRVIDASGKTIRQDTKNKTIYIDIKSN